MRLRLARACPLMRQFRAFAQVARRAGNSKIANVICSAFGERDNVIDMKPTAQWFAAPVASLLLFVQQGLNVCDRPMRSCVQEACATDMNASPSLSGVFLAPSASGFQDSFMMRATVLGVIRSEFLGVLPPPFARPLVPFFPVLQVVLVMLLTAFFTVAFFVTTAVLTVGFAVSLTPILVTLASFFLVSGAVLGLISLYARYAPRGKTVAVSALGVEELSGLREFLMAARTALQLGRHKAPRQCLLVMWAVARAATRATFSGATLGYCPIIP